MSSEIKFVISSLKATNGPRWTKVTDFPKKGTKVLNDGVTYEIISQESKKTSLIVRILAIVLTIISFGVLAKISAHIYNACFYGRKIKNFAVPINVLKNEKQIAVKMKKCMAEIRLLSSKGEKLNALASKSFMVNGTGLSCAFGIHYLFRSGVISDITASQLSKINLISAVSAVLYLGYLTLKINRCKDMKSTVC